MFSRPLFHLALIAVLGMLVYSNTFDVPFLFDDKPNIVDNPAIKDLRYFLHPSEAERFEGSFRYKGFIRRFVGHLTFALNYRLHGLDVTGYHAFNLAIHIVTAMLVYWLVGLTFRTPFMEGSSLREKSGYVALSAGLLFVCHPIQTQAVTYIVQRFASLAAMFYLMSLVLYIKYRLGTTHSHSPLKGGGGMAGSVLLYLASLLCAILAIKSKETAFTLPLAIVLYEFMFFRGGLKKRFLHLGPLFLTILIIPLTLVSLKVSPGEVLERITEATMVHTGMSRLEYLFTEFRVITTYVRLLFLPVGQSLDYDYPIYSSFFEPPVFLSFLFLLGIFGLGVYMLRRSRVTDPASRLIAFGIFWFFLALSVESSIIPLFVIFEHRVYLPSAGALIAVSTAASVFSRRKTGKAFMAMAMIVITFSAATYARNEVWRSETSLWEDAVRKYPLNVRAYANLSDAYHIKGMLDDAVRSYIKAIELAPDAPQAHNNLALVYLEKGMVEKAVEHYEEALRLDPENPLRHSRLGSAYMEIGMAEKAMEHFEAALRLNPDDATAHNNLGAAYQARGQVDRAIEQYRLAAELEPRFPTSYYNLGNAYYSKGLFDNAVQLYLIALKLNPDYPEAHGNLGLAYQSKGMADKAIEHYRAALELNPDYAQAHFNLGLVYFQQGFEDKAREEFKAALQIDPGYQRARQFLSKLDQKR